MVIGSSKDLSQAEECAQKGPSNAQEAISSFILSIALACFTPFNVMLYVFEMLARIVSTMWNGLSKKDDSLRPGVIAGAADDADSAWRYHEEVALESLRI
jgi:hypothetical protein